MGFPSKNTGKDCPFPLQGIFPDQGSNQRLLLWQVGSLPRSHLGSPSVYAPVCSYLSVTSISLCHLLTICQSVSSTCFFSSSHLCVNKSIYLSFVSSAHLSFTHRHICCLSINPSTYHLFIRHLSIYPGEGNGTPLQYSCLENPMDGGAW